MYVTYYSTSYATVLVTETITNTNAVTATDVATATVVTVVTVSISGANKARRLVSTDIAIPPSRFSPIASSTSRPVPHNTQCDYEEIDLNAITAYSALNRGLARRQAITSTDVVYTTVYVTTTVELTSVIASTIYSTSTLVEEVTTTSALNAQTTVQVTSTFTASDSPSTTSAPVAQTTVQVTSTFTVGSSSLTGGNSSGLSGGDVAGIAVGAVAGALIIAAILGLCIYRNCKKSTEEAATVRAPATTPVQSDPSLSSTVLPPSEQRYSDKMGPTTPYHPRSTTLPYQYDYYPVPAAADQQRQQQYHEADGRMLGGWRQMYENEHTPAELAAYQRFGMDAGELSQYRE